MFIIDNVKKILNIVLTVMVTLVLLLSLLIFFTNKGIRTPFGLQTYIVLSGSMSPEIEAGSLIFVKKIKVEEIKKNDIITYRVKSDKSTNLTHRVVEIDSNGEELTFITKGDANNVNDPIPVEENQIHGKVFFWIGNIGNIILFIQRNIYVFLGILVLLVLLSMYDSYKKT